MQQTVEKTMEDRRAAMGQRIRSIRDIPTLPAVVTRLNELLRSPHSTAREVADLLNSDQALALKVLKLVNSPYYGFEGRVQNINRAIVILGFNKVRNLALSVSALGMFQRMSAEILDYQGLWDHSVAVAVMCETVAEYIHSDESEDALIAGLLHDLGKFTLAVYFPDEYGEVARSVRDDKRLSFIVEKEMLGMDHGEVGGILARQWNLPRKLSASITWHNTPDQVRQFRDLGYLVHLSQFLVQALGIGNAGESVLPPLSQEVWDHYGFGENDVREIFSRFSTRFAAATELFY